MFQKRKSHSQCVDDRFSFLHATRHNMCHTSANADLFASVDATVHGHTRMQLERLLSGAGLSAGAALHSVSLSPPQLALAELTHGEWYDPQYSYTH